MRGWLIPLQRATATSTPVRWVVPMPPVLLEDIAVDMFMVSSFGLFVMTLFQPLLRVPSRQSFALFACGWALAAERHTITASLWVTGATTRKHFSRFSVFLGGPLYNVRWQMWAPLIRHAATWVPQDAPIVLALDDLTKKKAGRHLEGLDRYRNSAGSARQAYRPLRGLHFVLGGMRLPLPLWPASRITLPSGLALSLTAPLADKLPLAYRSRRTLARDIVDFVAQMLPTRAIRAIADGGYATKEFLRDLPQAVDVVSRLLSSAHLYAWPPASPRPCRGRPPRTGKSLGSPKTFARTRKGGHDHPTEARAQVQSWVGLWHSVLPGRPIRIVGGRREAPHKPPAAGQRTLRPSVEACCTTALTRSLEAVLDASRARWAVAIDRRDAQAFSGVGQDQWRQWRRIVGANTFRLVRAAARTLWCMEHAKRTGSIELCRYRPWYRHKVAPSQLDIVSICRETLQAAGVFPIARFRQAVDENHDEPENTLPFVA